jgi:hypothetical protein
MIQNGNPPLVNIKDKDHQKCKTTQNGKLRNIKLANIVVKDRCLLEITPDIIVTIVNTKEK